MQRRVRRHLREATYDEVLDEVARSDLIYVGDYHTLKQAQRSFLKLVRRAGARGRAQVLALEFVRGRHQRAVDDFLRRRVPVSRFLERIEYRRHQPFDIWPHVAPIFEEARRRSCRSSPSTPPGRSSAVTNTLPAASRGPRSTIRARRC